MPLFGIFARIFQHAKFGKREYYEGIFRSTLLLVAAALSVVSCSKDGERGRLSFEKSALFFMAGETKSVKFSASDVRSLTVSSKPAEWGDPVINTETKTVRITAPAPIPRGLPSRVR